MRNLIRVAATAIMLSAAGYMHTGPVRAQDAAVVQKLSENVYSIFHSFYSSLVVIGTEGVLVVDPANSWRAGIVKQEIAKLTDKPVTRIVLTHEHFDHVGGTEVFEGAEIIAQENVKAVFDLDPLGVAPDKLDTTFAREHTIDMGTTKVELKFMGAGDGVATTVVYLPLEKIVATADLYDENRLTLGAFLDDKNMLGARAILNEGAGSVTVGCAFTARFWSHSATTFTVAPAPSVLLSSRKAPSVSLFPSKSSAVATVFSSGR